MVTDPAGEVVALQAIELDPRTGGKSGRTDRPKRSRGPIAEGTVFLGDTGERPSVLVIGEGVETVLSRRPIGPCDAHACLGAVRWIEPAPHHKRVEVVADNDGRDKARKLARRCAERGLAAYVVTVPDALGPKADLNDLLRELGENAVRLAVEDAERIEPPSAGRQRSEYELEIGSDIEIAQKSIDKIEDLYGPVIVDEGKVWRFDRTHWVPIETDQLARLIHKAAGAVYYDAEDKLRSVRLNKSRVVSIADAIVKYRQRPEFFASAPAGINCEAGFVRIAEDGAVELLPHSRRWRQRHVVRGRWPCRIPSAERRNSLLAKYLTETFKGDPDGRAKIELVGELLGCAATNRATKLRSPKAVVLFSEEGATGKSAFLHLLRSLPNPEAVASVPPVQGLAAVGSGLKLSSSCLGLFEGDRVQGLAAVGSGLKPARPAEQATFGDEVQGLAAVGSGLKPVVAVAAEDDVAVQGLAAVGSGLKLAPFGLGFPTFGSGPCRCRKRIETPGYHLLVRAVGAKVQGLAAVGSGLKPRC